MSCDALFQSGMGALDAPRTEERFLIGALAAQSGFCAVLPAGSLRAAHSAKALPHRRVRTTIP